MHQYTLLEQVLALESQSRIAWAAGLFEDEGTISVKRDTRRQHNVTLIMQMDMTDIEPLATSEHIVCTGVLRGPYQLKRPNHKPYWVWMSSVASGVINVWKAFRPFMSERRLEQGDLALLTRYNYEKTSIHSNLKLNIFPDYIVERDTMLDGV